MPLPNVSKTCSKHVRVQTCPKNIQTCPNVSKTCPNVSKTCPNVSKSVQKHYFGHFFGLARPCPKLFHFSFPYKGVNILDSFWKLNSRNQRHFVSRLAPLRLKTAPRQYSRFDGIRHTFPKHKIPLAFECPNSAFNIAVPLLVI